MSPSASARRALCTAFCLVALILPATGSALSPDLVIGQVYGGGGNTGAMYTNDFVELFNRGAAAVDVTGWSVQYSSATGNSWQVTNISGVIPAGGYFLVQEGAGAGGTMALPTPDVTGSIAMGATAGKVALVTNQLALTCGTALTRCTTDPVASVNIRDFVGYGTTATDYEGAAPALAPSNTTVDLRLTAGCTETDNNAGDFTTAPPAPRNSSTPANPCGGDAAPAVSSSTPANAATGVFVDANISITFSEPVSVTDPWFTISCASSGPHTAAVGGGPTTYTLNPAVDFSSGENCVVTILAAQVADQDGAAQSMAANHAFSFTTATPAIEIHEVQGAAHTSPRLGESVTLQPAIVTAVRSNGFYLQDPTPDANEATSDAIFVFTSSAPTVDDGGTARPIIAGDEVSVSGSVVEFRGGGASSANLTLTEISGPTVILLSETNGLPAAMVIGVGGRTPPTTVIEDDVSGSVETSGVFDPATDGIDFYESLEAVRVQVNNPVVTGPTNDFGELWVLPDDGAGASLRTARGGIVVRPGDFNPERIQLDDVLAETPDANVGDHLAAPAIGVLNYDFGNFELLVTSDAVVVPGGLAREMATAAGPLELAVATFNVENLDPGDPPSKFAELAGLIVNNLRNPDVIGLEEVQDNNGPTNDTVTDASVTLTTLANAIVAAGGPLYDFRQINPVDDQDGGEPGGNIRVAFLFRTDRGVQFVDRPGGAPTTATGVVAGASGPELTASPGRVSPTDTAWTSSRKPLAGEFLFRGERFFVIVNHFNSKGGDQPLFGRFQPPTLSSEAQRLRQAQLLNDFVDAILALDPNANVIALGDFNDFEFSAPLRTLMGDVLNDLIETLPPNERYGYVFEGNSQTLDHILVSDNILANTPLFYDVVHANAEFAVQASDHDPSVVRLVDQARLGVTKAASSDAVARGGVVSYTLRVTNQGPKAATGVTLTDPLPAGAELLGVTPSQGSCLAGPAVTCALGTLANGASATVMIEVRTILEGVLTNVADVSGAQGDPNLANNRALAVTVVRPAEVEPPEPRDCRVIARPRTIVAGRRTAVKITAELLGPRAPQSDVLVRLKGAGITRTARTGTRGSVRVTVRPARAGSLRITAPELGSCSTSVRVRPKPRSRSAGAAAGLTGRRP